MEQSKSLRCVKEVSNLRHAKDTELIGNVMEHTGASLMDQNNCKNKS